MAKKIWNIEWEYKSSGRSQHEFDTLEELMAEHVSGAGLIEDFGDPDEFDEDYDTCNGWRIKSIEEVR